ncbi:uncharacterized protein LOC135161964 [Diachasmimorpha longicaudata]|uniref:uncharacterized protein LOC135161964 n=1 Tax=Diachasmimorpha longicaudata TaxID=58733 RepID=UPI0030B86E1F
MRIGSSAGDNLEQNDVFRKILHEGFPDEIIEDVVLLNKEPVTKKGENYLSLLTRLTFKYVCSPSGGDRHEKVQKILNVILKEEPDSDSATLETIHRMDIFNVEQQLLQDIVPKVEGLIDRRLAAKVYHCSTEPRIIAMEDLSILGFKNTNRKVGLSEDEVYMILENLAEFHAGTIRLAEQDPGCLTRFSIGLLNMTPTFYKMIEDTMRNVARQIRTWSDPKFLPLSEKLENMSEVAVARLREVYKLTDDEIGVLNHGDLWCNNIMFQYDDNRKLENLRFVDYQFSIWSSPAIDITYFLSCAPELKIKGTQDDLFLERYLTRLSSTMKRIGCTSEPPTMEQLKKSLHKRQILSLITGIVFFAIMIADDGDITDLEDILHKETHDADTLKNPRVKAAVEKMLPIWNDRGYLD